MAPTPLQNRKYLCQAPKPDTWDDIKDVVISNLGKDAENKIMDTLEFIKKEHPLQYKSGPGRKSNAEHATHFYQYLLEIVQERKQNQVDRKGNNAIF